jgi:hypothetical protein
MDENKTMVSEFHISRCFEPCMASGMLETGHV